VSSGGPAVHGTVAPEYDAVRDAFERNLAERGDGGCAFAAVVAGLTVVDLWGSAADGAGRPWQRDTTAVIFSGSKGVVATLLLVLFERGLLEPGALVADVWPEFGVAGRDRITVAQLLAHAGGVPGLREPIDRSQLAQPDQIAARIAAEPPLIEPGRPCYHALTYGWLAAELVRRVDGRRLGQLLADELAEPLGLDIAIGVDPSSPLAASLATVRAAPDFALSAYLSDDPDPRLGLVYGNPPLEPEAWNGPGLLAVEVPAANAVATARSLAVLYGGLVRSEDPLLRPDTVATGRTEASRGDDPLSGRPLRFGPTGYELAGTPSELGPPADAFGHTGAGGGSHGAWPSLRTGFSYVTADLRPENTDGRARDLLRALHTAIAA
jgi:CubicO group peptidase (beta-lactamase class C family)